MTDPLDTWKSKEEDAIIARSEEAELAQLRAKCERLEANCAGLRSGISALTALVIEHHAATDDGTGSLVCDVCRRPESRLWWRISDAAKDSDCGVKLLARLNEAKDLIRLARDVMNEVAAYGNCDCNFPEGDICIVCECENKVKACDEWLKGGQP